MEFLLLTTSFVDLFPFVLFFSCLKMGAERMKLPLHAPRIEGSNVFAIDVYPVLELRRTGPGAGIIRIPLETIDGMMSPARPGRQKNHSSAQ